MKVLIVDNNVELCRVLEEYINKQHDLETIGLAHDGEEALELIKTLQPDVVLLDITMPYLDGIGVLERLGTLNLPRRPKVIVITAFGTDKLILRLQALNPDYFIVKPFRLQVLVERIRQFSEKEGALPLTELAASVEPNVGFKQRITQLLHNMGVPSHYKGFCYLREAALMCVEDGYLGGGLTKEMYPALAKKYGTTSGGVEAAIRNALISAWENGNSAYIRELCGSAQISRVPTNSLIIAKISEEAKSF